MKKILLTLVLLILFIPGVNAEVDESCTLVGSYLSTEHKFVYNSRFHQYYLKTNDNIFSEFPINKNLYYTFYFDNADSINLNNYSFNFSGDDRLTITKNDYYYLFNLNEYQPEYNAQIISNPELLEGWNNLYVYSSESEIVCLPLAEEEPEKPTPLPADVTLDSFYTICIEKIVELSNFTIENKFLLFAFSIIIFFTIIGLFIHLFKGGRRQ